MAEYRTMHWKGTFEGETRLTRKGGPYKTYLPDALSGRRFLLQGETAADLSDAERAVAQLNDQAKTLRNTEALARLVLCAEALSSSKIEGLVIGPRRILKAELDSSAQDEMALEVLNNITAMDEALSEATADRITVKTMQRVHEKLLAGTRLASYAGNIRTEQNWIGGNSYNPCGAAYVPPLTNSYPNSLRIWQRSATQMSCPLWPKQPLRMRNLKRSILSSMETGVLVEPSCILSCDEEVCAPSSCRRYRWLSPRTARHTSRNWPGSGMLAPQTGRMPSKASTRGSRFSPGARHRPAKTPSHSSRTSNA